MPRRLLACMTIGHHRPIATLPVVGTMGQFHARGSSRTQQAFMQCRLHPEDNRDMWSERGGEGELGGYGSTTWVDAGGPTCSNHSGRAVLDLVPRLALLRKPGKGYLDTRQRVKSAHLLGSRTRPLCVCPTRRITSGGFLGRVEIFPPIEKIGNCWYALLVISP